MSEIRNIPTVRICQGDDSDYTSWCLVKEDGSGGGWPVVPEQYIRVVDRQTWRAYERARDDMFEAAYFLEGNDD